MSAPERIWANEGLEWHSFDCSDVKAGWTHPYILATPAALAASPEVAKLVAEAEARGMERAQSLARRFANDSEREAERKDTTAQQRIGLNLVRDTAATLESAFRAEAAAIRSEATK